MKPIVNGTKGGAIAAAAVAVVVNTDKYTKGELDAATAAKQTAADTAVGAAKGAATGSLTMLLARVVPKLMRGGAGTVAVATVTVEVGVDAVRLARGTIDPRQFARRSAGHAVKSGAAWALAKAGAAAGAALGPVGAAVGGAAGGLVGWLAADVLTQQV